MKDKGKPEPGKQYALTGAGKSIANGDTWAESEVKEPKERTFRVTSYERCWFDQIIKAKDKDEAIKKADAGDWGQAEGGERDLIEAEEINGN